MAILIDYPEPHIAVLTIDNPAKRNAMSREMMADLAAYWDELEHSEVRAIVITGAASRLSRRSTACAPAAGLN